MKDNVLWTIFNQHQDSHKACKRKNTTPPIGSLAFVSDLTLCKAVASRYLIVDDKPKPRSGGEQQIRA